MVKATPSLALATRSALPDDLTFLLSRYPRCDWHNHENLGDMAQFWLKRHDMFRELGGQLAGAVDDYREERADAQSFAGFFVPRLRFFLQQLNAHHHIEDSHYFPIFAQAEHRFSHGFDLLDADHHVIHDALEANAAAANAMLKILSSTTVDPRAVTDDYAQNADQLIAMLTRHLHDEEDLIIPLILDRTETALGI